MNRAKAHQIATDLVSEWQRGCELVPQALVSGDLEAHNRDTTKLIAQIAYALSDDYADEAAQETHG